MLALSYQHLCTHLNQHAALRHPQKLFHGRDEYYHHPQRGVLHSARKQDVREVVQGGKLARSRGHGKAHVWNK